MAILGLLLNSGCSSPINKSQNSTSSVSLLPSNSSASKAEVSWLIYESPLGVEINYPDKIYYEWKSPPWHETKIEETADGFIISTRPRLDINYWQIHVAAAKDERAIRKAIGIIDWLKNCPISIGQFDSSNTASVTIVNTVSGIDEYKEGECYSFAAYKILFNRKLGKVAFWEIGQEAIYDAPEGENYDGKIVDSFKFIED